MGKGHNFYGGLSAEHLCQFIERIERLEEEKKNIADDIKEVFTEAKSAGFDTPTMRQIIKIRKIEANELEEQEYLLDTYKRALGMTPTEDDEEVDLSLRTKTEGKPLEQYRSTLEAAESVSMEETSANERDFLEQLRIKIDGTNQPKIITQKQIEWLEDIAGRA